MCIRIVSLTFVMYVFHILDGIISKSHRIMQYRNTKIKSMRVGTVFLSIILWGSSGLVRILFCVVSSSLMHASFKGNNLTCVGE